MEKPVSMRIEELRISLINDINSSQLPLFIVESLMKELTQNVIISARQLAEQERQNYSDHAAKQKEEKTEI